MNEHNTERLSGLLDGELTGVSRWMAERHLRGCAACAVEMQRIQQVRALLAAAPRPAPMSDTPEFFWSQVKRGIERAGGEQIELPMPGLSIGDRLRQHQFALAAAAGALVLLVAVVVSLKQQREGPGPVAKVTESSFAQVMRVVTYIPDTVATVIDSKDADATVIWVSGLPWTSDIDAMKDHFENLDET